MIWGSKKQLGFTLLELLAVIAIIALLFVLLLPMLSKAKATAQRTVCLNDLKQINIGVMIYAGDFNDIPPNTKGDTSITNAPWIGYKELMKNYLGIRGNSSANNKIFACPSDKFY